MSRPWCGSAVKNLPAMQEMGEMQIQSLSWEGPLEKEMAPHSSILSWKIPWTEGTSRLQSMGLQRVRHDWALSTVMSEGDCLSRCLIHAQLDIYMFFFKFSSHISYYGVLRRVSCVMQWILDDFMKSSCVYVNLNQLISPCPPLFLLGNCKFLLGNHKSVRPFPFDKEVHSSPFLDST